jgi:hypothetical protein
MICDLRQDSEIVADGQPFYKNGKFVFKKKVKRAADTLPARLSQ